MFQSEVEEIFEMQKVMRKAGFRRHSRIERLGRRTGV